MVECWLPYGKTEVYVTIDLSEIMSIAEPPKIEPTSQVKEIISKALEENRGKKLSELVAPDCTVAIALDGKVSPQVAVKVLNYFVEQLVSLIVPRERITILLANYPRDHGNVEMMKSINNTEELKGVKVIEHLKGTAVSDILGTTRYHTPIQINNTYIDAKLKIAIGEVNVDPYTGFTGAHSALLPGLSSLGSTVANRRLIFRGDSKPGYVEVNPCKEDAFEFCKVIGCDLSVQLVVNQSGRLINAFAGNMEETFGQAIYSIGAGYQYQAEAGADIVVVSAGGSKWDYNLYSATWALYGAQRLVKKGGAIVLLAECLGVLGADSYFSLAHLEQISELERRYALGAEALQLLKTTTSKCPVWLVSSLPKYMVEPLGLNIAKTANEAYESATEGRRSTKTLIIPYGCSTVPYGL
jgi:nickel-dependent lactate racemase